MGEPIKPADSPSRDSSSSAPHSTPRTDSRETGRTTSTMLGLTVTCAVLLVAYAYAQGDSNATLSGLPPQAVFVDPASFTVLGNNGSFRTDANAQLFNPTNTTPPFIQIFDPSFLGLIGPDASIVEIARNETFAFAHEAPIWVSESNRVYFASNDGGALGDSGLDKNNVVSFIDLDEVDDVLANMDGQPEGNGSVNVQVIQLDLPDTIQMTNGGTGPHQGSLLLINSGRGPLPPSLALVNPDPPHNATVILDNFFGRQFNSLNDVKVHPTSGAIFFTDVTYGFLNGFRPAPLLPNQVYRLDPKTSAVRVVADGFDKCNGIAFTADGKTAYISDTGIISGNFGVNQTEPSTIYAFDVDPTTGAFINRRVFAYVDTGVPDGIQVDTMGRVYSGCGDGVHVWSQTGTLLGKFFTGSTSANMVFAGNGDLVILGETSVFLARLGGGDARGQELAT